LDQVGSPGSRLLWHFRSRADAGTRSLVRSTTQQFSDEFRVDTYGCVEVPHGRVVIRLRCVEYPTVVVEVGVTGSRFNGFIVIVECMLVIALGKIRGGTISEQKKTLVALENFAVQRLCACLNDPGRRRVPAAINARLDHDMLFPIELMLTDRRLDIEPAEVFNISIYPNFPHAVGEFVRTRRAKLALLARTRLGCLRSGPVA